MDIHDWEAVAVTQETRAVKAEQQRDELLRAIKRIDAINDNPLWFIEEINDVTQAAIAKIEGEE